MLEFFFFEGLIFVIWGENWKIGSEDIGKLECRLELELVNNDLSKVVLSLSSSFVFELDSSGTWILLSYVNWHALCLYAFLLIIDKSFWFVKMCFSLSSTIN